jgi:acyl dehydratase|tara:strand:- start:69 stop:509 length:441 start_codon:yes stop_codon:yes gene_type:complete
LDTSYVGWESQPKTISVEKGQLKFFAKATGASSRAYWDEDVANAQGHPALRAPPTFLFTLDLLAPAKEKSVLQQMGIDIGRILHGEQRFRYGKPIYAGDEISLISRVTDIYEKKGGKLQFIVTETTATNQHEEFVGTMINSIVVRK